MPNIKKRLITTRVNEVVALAEKLYGEIPKVNLSLFNHARHHALASVHDDYLLVQFSEESINKYFDDLLNDIIPHEIAHLIAIYFYKNRSHNKQWKEICLALGGDGRAVTHNVLTPKRLHRYHKYQLDSDETIWLSTMKHRQIQNGILFMTEKTREHIKREHFTGISGTCLDIRS